MFSIISERVVNSLRLSESSRISSVLTLPAVYRATSRSLNSSMVSWISACEASSFMVSSVMLWFRSSIFWRVVSICSCTP